MSLLRPLSLSREARRNTRILPPRSLRESDLLVRTPLSAKRKTMRLFAGGRHTWPP